MAKKEEILYDQKPDGGMTRIRRNGKAYESRPVKITRDDGSTIIIVKMVEVVDTEEKKMNREKYKASIKKKNKPKKSSGFISLF